MMKRKLLLLLMSLGGYASLVLSTGKESNLQMNMMLPEGISLVEINQVAVEYNKKDSIIKLQELEVAARKEKEFSETAKIVRVITAAEIALLPVQSIDALLETLPGVDVRQRSTGGTQADISLRGGTFDQVLILLNGVNITDPQTGHHNLNIPIDFSEISSVEILQGAAARRYGNQAFSGAINIITNPLMKNKLSVDLNYGSFGTTSQKLSFSTGNERMKQFTAISNGLSDGYIANTDYRLLNVYHHAVGQLKKAGKLDLQLSYQQKSFGAQGFYTQVYPYQFEQTRIMFGSGGWSLDKNHFSASVKAYWRKHYDRFELFRDMEGALPWYTGHNYHLTDVYGASAQGSYVAGIGKFSAGLESRSEHIYSTALGVQMEKAVDNMFEPEHPFTKEANRLLHTFFADYTKNIGNIRISAGGSTLYSNDYGWNTNIGGELNWQMWKSPFQMYASANTASRLPTFTDLYLVNSVQKGNPALQAEKAINYEAGMKYRTSALKADFSVFSREGRNIIDWVRYIGMTKWESMNLSTLNTLGFEISADYQTGLSWLKNIKAGYTYLQTDKLAAGYDSKYILDNLKHHFNLKASSEILQKWTMIWDASFQDRAGNYIVSGDIVMDYQPVFMLNHRSQYAFKNFIVYVDVNNILNQQSVDFGGLPLPGTAILGGIKYQLKNN